MADPEKRIRDSWESLLADAEREVLDLMSQLPDDLKSHALQLPVIYERFVSQTWVDEGYDADLLGMFVGDSCDATDTSASAVPPHILLFLESIWGFVEQDREAFLEEVRITYLHEFGHYLGLDESDLEERGLL